MKLYTESFKWGSSFFLRKQVNFMSPTPKGIQIKGWKKVYGYNLFVLYVIHFGDQIQLTLLQFFYAWDELLILLGSLWYCQ